MLSTFLRLLLALTAATAANAGGFDTRNLLARRVKVQASSGEDLIGLMNPPQPVIPAGLPRGLIILFGADIKNTDIPSIARGHLTLLRNRILVAANVTNDKLSKYHLQDIAERIKQAMNPK